mmetsp:Transcript_51831/g.120912  ORF Transcript_51831/g.120912 Transcript_51831/m.120912 type:complete len:203 (-) Transcript_51831:908-1516(-)
MELHAARQLGGLNGGVTGGLRLEDCVGIGACLDAFQDLDHIHLLALLNDLTLLTVGLGFCGLHPSMLLLLLGHLTLCHNLLGIGSKGRALHAGKEAVWLLGFHLALGQRVQDQLPLDQLALEQVQELFLVLLEIPAHGDADHLLARGVLEALLQLLLDRRGAVHERKVADACRVILVRRVGHVHLLEQAQLADAKQDAGNGG